MAARRVRRCGRLGNCALVLQAIRSRRVPVSSVAVGFCGFLIEQLGRNGCGFGEDDRWILSPDWPPGYPGDSGGYPVHAIDTLPEEDLSSHEVVGHLSPPLIDFCFLLG